MSEAPIEEPTADAAPAGDPTTSTIEESDPPETESDSPRAAESTVKSEAIKTPEESSPTGRTTLARTTAVSDDVPTTALTMAAADMQANVLSAHQATAAAVAPAGPVTGLSNLASNFVAAVLSPFLAPGPASPAQAPVLWAVLAWARRESQRTTVTTTPAVTPQETSLGVDDAGAPVALMAASGPAAAAAPAAAGPLASILRRSRSLTSTSRTRTLRAPCRVRVCWPTTLTSTATR